MCRTLAKANWLGSGVKGCWRSQGHRDPPYDQGHRELQAVETLNGAGQIGHISHSR